jgi:3,4-dihydroxy 2-butanone 4-phosphate synthase/GTP cyclohydrolase II
MVAQNREMYRTDFTVSVDAARGVTTGISAHDRAETIQTIANPKSTPDDLVQPGHVFPLRAKDGGVLRRAGHTEAAVDLARMAGLEPAGVLCEILHDDGTMARLPELMEFRKKHGLRICTIQSLIAHRRLTEKLVEAEQVVKLPTDYGDFDLHLYRSKLDGAHHLALVKGKRPGGTDWLRAHRLVEVLLRLRTAQARKLLERWAEDDASWLGVESRAALAIFPARKAE